MFFCSFVQSYLTNLAFLYFCTKLSDKLVFFVFLYKAICIFGNFLYKAIWQMRGCRQAEHASDQEQCGRSNACISYLAVWCFELYFMFVGLMFWVAFHICRSEVLNCVPYLLLLSFELNFIFVVLMFWIVFPVYCCCVLNCFLYLLLLSFELNSMFVFVFDCICFENTTMPRVQLGTLMRLRNKHIFWKLSIRLKK